MISSSNILLILLGPTGTGKTDISIKLAQKMPDIEIISADSMQIYKYMDIGTAKPNKNILKIIKHHMIDIVDPSDNFDVIQYSKLATNTILDVFKRGKIPILVGGSGLYISSIINPLFNGPAKNNEYREILEEEAKVYGNKYLHDKLSKIDSDSALKIEVNDLRRIIRALEVYKSTGKNISYLQKKAFNKNTKFKYHMIGLKRNRENLYQRINLRVDKMIKEGFIEEVKMLKEKGYKEDLNSMQGLGYKQINKHLNGIYPEEVAIDLIKTETRHYAKRQMTWFKNKMKNIEWIDLDKYSENEAISKLKKILQKKVISKLKFPFNMKRIGIDMGSDNLKAVVIDGKDIIPYQKKIDGKPIDALKEILDEMITKHGNEAYLGVTGMNSISLSEVLNEKQLINEYIATKAGIASLDLDIQENEKFAVIDVGASNQRCYEFGKDKNNGKIILEHHYLQNKCGAGSGLLLEHMAKRFEYGSIEELSNVANQTEKTIKLSAKCGVFRESDVVHQQQKGTPKEVLAASLYRASADSFKTILANGMMPEGKIILIGGLSLSKAFVKHLMDVCKIFSERVIIPKQALHIGAIGAAIYGQQVNLNNIIKKLEKKLTQPFDYKSQGPLIFKKSKIMKPKEDWPYGADIPLASLGIDIGSVSTKAALIAEINGKFRLLAYHYRRTEIDPVGAAIDVINKVYHQVIERGYKIEKVIAGTTGSGRQLTGFIVGASKEHIVDEITAQAAGIITFYPQKEFSIIEFGGQDSKYININQGVVVDFAMNNACAAGTGALLEKYAMRRGIKIEDLGDIALRAKNPPDIDSTCAVLSEQSIIKYEQNNVSLEDLCAALTLATARNYLAKVVSGSEIKEKVVFQGATAFNLGQVAALETVLGKGIIVPPWPHITGAIGAAKYAYDSSNSGNFRGFNKISNLKYNIESYQCINKGCGNDCNITRAEIKGKEKIFYFIGDRCQRYSAKKDEKQIKPPNLFKERQKIMEDSCK